MTYKCLECGNIFEDGEQAVWRESRGEFWGKTCHETLSGCPLCKGAYEETVSCKVCGSKQLEDELTDGVCKECVSDIVFQYKYNVEKCFLLSEKNEDKDTVKINGFLSCMFSEEEINKILFRELVLASVPNAVDCTNYIESDKDWFIENAIKEAKK